MARSRARGARPAAAAPKRQAKSRRKAAPAAIAEVEVVEEEKGLGIDDGVVIVTTLCLLVAFLFVDALRGQYGTGLFFG